MVSTRSFIKAKLIEIFIMQCRPSHVDGHPYYKTIIPPHISDGYNISEANLNEVTTSLK